MKTDRRTPELRRLMTRYGALASALTHEVQDLEQDGWHVSDELREQERDANLIMAALEHFDEFLRGVSRDQHALAQHMADDECAQALLDDLRHVDA